MYRGMKHRRTHKVLILIVEDNKESYQMYRTVFEQSGFEVMFYNNAEGFFTEAVSNLEPDIISMDLMLASAEVAQTHDGFEAIEQLKSNPQTKDIPVFVLTNFFEEGKVKRAKELGAVDFINLTGQSIQKIPAHYKRYLEDPKHYKPSHPLFRKGSDKSV